jgi:uncharacterized protein involved in exopolysaccharide biosynthesis
MRRLDRVSTSPSCSSDIAARNFVRTATLLESFESVVRFLIRNRYLFTTPIVLVVLIALLCIAIAKPIFTAHTRLLLNPRLPQVVGELSDAHTLLDRSEIANQVALIKSDKIARIAVAGSKLPALPEGSAALILDPDDPQSQSEIAAFQRGLTVNRLRVSYVLEIAFSSPDPSTAARMANAAADAYIEDQLAARAVAAYQGSRWLEERIEELRLQMNLSALRLQEFKAKRDYRLVGEIGFEGSGSIADNAAAPPASGKQNPSADEPPRQITLEELESNAATYRKIYENYLQAYTESVQHQSFPISSARVIDRATVPSSASHPKRVLLLLLATAAGATMGLIMALVRESLNW